MSVLGGLIDTVRQQCAKYLDLADMALASQNPPVPHFLEGHQALLHDPPHLDTERQIAVPAALVIVVALIEPAESTVRVL